MALVPRDSVYQKTISNVEEIKARQGRLLLDRDPGGRPSGFADR